MQKLKIVRFLFPALMASALFLTGCASSLFYKPQPVPALSSLSSLGKPMTCRDIGILFYDVKQLQNRRMSREDVFWKITPTTATFGEQGFYYALIDTAFDLKPIPRNALIRETCEESIPTLQKLANVSSGILYGGLEEIYNFYDQQMQNQTTNSYLGLISRQELYNVKLDEEEAYKRHIIEVDPKNLRNLSDPEYKTFIEIKLLAGEAAIKRLYSNTKVYITKEEFYREFAPKIMIRVVE